MNKATRERIALAHQLADTAGALLLRHFRRPLKLVDKAPGKPFDPGTNVEKVVERRLRQIIYARYPEDAILGEEFGPRPGTSGYRWILDPIDGTRAFVTGLPLWGTLIALQSRGRPILGLLDQPFLSERFVGRAGSASLVGATGRRRIHSRRCAALKFATLSTTHPSDAFDDGQRRAFARLADRVRVTQFGGDCYAYALLAMGLVDIVIDADLEAWDVAALVPIVEGAGGCLSDWNGQSYTQQRQVIASGDARIHKQALALLRQTSR